MSVPGLIFLLIWGLLIAIILVLFWHPQRSRTKTNTSADHQSTNAVFRNDDQYWSAGFFYNNPDDPAMFVPKRFGLGWTLNFGHPQARVFLITMLVLVLVLVLVPPLVTLFGGGSIHSSGCHSFGCQP